MSSRSRPAAPRASRWRRRSSRPPRPAAARGRTAQRGQRPREDGPDQCQRHLRPSWRGSRRRPPSRSTSRARPPRGSTCTKVCCVVTPYFLRRSLSRVEVDLDQGEARRDAVARDGLLRRPARGAPRRVEEVDDLAPRTRRRLLGVLGPWTGMRRLAPRRWRRPKWQPAEAAALGAVVTAEAGARGETDGSLVVPQPESTSKGHRRGGAGAGWSGSGACVVLLGRGRCAQCSRTGPGSPALRGCRQKSVTTRRVLPRLWPGGPRSALACTPRCPTTVPEGGW